MPFQPCEHCEPRNGMETDAICYHPDARTDPPTKVKRLGTIAPENTLGMDPSTPMCTPMVRVEGNSVVLVEMSPAVTAAQRRCSNYSGGSVQSPQASSSSVPLATQA